jgi:ribose-phosphate pyrophosphokinase
MTTVLHAFRDEAAEAQRLANALRVPLAFVDVHAFPDGEIVPCVPVPAATTIVYRSLDQPNTKLVELLLAVDAWRRNGAQRLVLVAPYLPYMRQDMAFRTGEPVSQRVIANLLDAAFDRIVTIDPHLHRTHSLAELFPTCQCTHLFGADALVPHLRAFPLLAGTVVVGPDVESAPWVRRIAAPLGLAHTTMRKRRQGDTEVELVAPVDFDPAGCPVLLVDDICSTGSTLRKATCLLKSLGAGEITIFITHALGGKKVLAELLRAGASRVLSTDSTANPVNGIHLADLLAHALREPG